MSKDSFFDMLKAAAAAWKTADRQQHLPGAPIRRPPEDRPLKKRKTSIRRSRALENARNQKANREARADRIRKIPAKVKERAAMLNKMTSWQRHQWEKDGRKDSRLKHFAKLPHHRRVRLSIGIATAKAKRDAATPPLGWSWFNSGRSGTASHLGRNAAVNMREGPRRATALCGAKVHVANVVGADSLPGHPCQRCLKAAAKMNTPEAA